MGNCSPFLIGGDFLGYSINNKTKRIALVRGDTLRAQVEILVNDEVYTPVSGDKIRFSMKRNYSSSRILIHKKIPNDTLILYLEPKDTKKLAFGNYVYDIEITFANGDVDTFIRGEFKIEPEVE